MRIFLLRALLGWWMVPGAWLVCWPIYALVFGRYQATTGCMMLTLLLWDGVPADG